MATEGQVSILLQTMRFNDEKVGILLFAQKVESAQTAKICTKTVENSKKAKICTKKVEFSCFYVNSHRSFVLEGGISTKKQKTAQSVEICTRKQNLHKKSGVGTRKAEFAQTMK